MLKTIPPSLTPELLWSIAAMGHGDRLAVVNANYPAYSMHERVIVLAGVSLVDAIASILQLMPVDDIGDRPAVRMVADGQVGDLPQVHCEVQRVVDAAEGRAVEMLALERTPFFEQAGGCFAVVHTSDNRPFGCFVFTKGVVRAT
jgi:L-fucose mutarotase